MLDYYIESLQNSDTASPEDKAFAEVTAAFENYGVAFADKDVRSVSEIQKDFCSALSRLRALIASIPTQVPQGFWLAPIRVTPEMTEAALEVDDLYRMGRPELPARLYQAMRREAPLAPRVSVTPPAQNEEPSQAQLQNQFEVWACSAEGNYSEGDLLKYSAGAHQHVVDGHTYVNSAVEHDWEVWKSAIKRFCTK